MKNIMIAHVFQFFVLLYCVFRLFGLVKSAV